MMANTPNYQGLFLRGYGGQVHTKNNGSIIGNTATSHWSGEIGQVQGDAARRIFGSTVTNWGDSYTGLNCGLAIPGAHNVSAHNYLEPKGNGALTMFGGRMDYLGNKVAGSIKNWMKSIGIDSALTTPAAAENRPANIAVRYLIRTR